MRCIRIVGPCLVAALALAGLFSSSAMAKKLPPITGPIVQNGGGEIYIHPEPTPGQEEGVFCHHVQYSIRWGVPAGHVTAVSEDVIFFTECFYEPSGNPAPDFTELTGHDISWWSSATGEAEDELTGRSEVTFAEAGKGIVEGGWVSQLTPLNTMTTTFRLTAEVEKGKQVPEPKTALLTEYPESKPGKKYNTLIEGKVVLTNAKVAEKIKGKKGKEETIEREDPTEIHYLGKEDETPDYGRCQTKKKGHYSDPNCTMEAFKEKKGTKKYDGKYEFEPA